MAQGEKTKTLWQDPKYREHMQKVHKGYMPTNLEKMIAYQKSDEGRGKVSLRFKGGNPWNKGLKIEYQPRPKTKRSIDFYKKIGLKGLLKQQTSKEPTSIEKKVYEELKQRGILFEDQKLINGKFLVDVYIPKLNLIIECDGDYWHSLDRVKKKDKAENAYLTKCGFNLLRFSETEINSGNFKERLVD